MGNRLATASIRRVGAVRHAVKSYQAVLDSLEYLRWQLVKTISGNIWNRYKRLFLGIRRRDKAAFDSFIFMQMRQRAEDKPYGETSFAAFIDTALVNTYVGMGSGGRSYEVRVNWVSRILVRAQKLTIGSFMVGWFLDALCEQLNHKIEDGFFVEAMLVPTLYKQMTVDTILFEVREARKE